jgi:hypothetical protein
MQLFVKIFQAVGMAMNNAFTKGRTATQNDFDLAKLFTWRKAKTAIHTGKMTHYIQRTMCTPILDTTIMKQ